MSFHGVSGLVLGHLACDVSNDTLGYVDAHLRGARVRTVEPVALVRVQPVRLARLKLLNSQYMPAVEPMRV